MDPITHGLLGAATGYVFAGRKLGWRAAGVGAVAGLCPDLDILIRSESDPLLKVEYHRHFTHSFPFSPFGAAIAASFWILREKYRSNWKSFWFAALMSWWSHILCDSWTSYGTQFLVPFTNRRFSWDLMSIIDPVFTFTLLTGLVAARWATRRARREESPPVSGADYQPKGVIIALVAGAFLLAMGGLQKHRAHAAQTELARQRGHEIERWQVLPTLGNNVLWRSLYLADGQIYRDRIRVGWLTSPTFATNDVLSLVTRETLTREEKQRDVTHDSFTRFQWFSDGWVARAPDDATVLGDARYSLSSGKFYPIWGIRFTPPDAPTEIEWVNRSRQRRLDMRELWSEITGTHPGYRIIAVP